MVAGCMPFKAAEKGNKDLASAIVNGEVIFPQKIEQSMSP
jgi:hypothetical protein